MKSKTILKIIIILVIATAIVAFAIVKFSKTDQKTDEETYIVKKEVYENVIEIAGTISAAKKQTLQALSDGTVLGVYVKKGDRVKKGDIIIQLDATEQEYNLAKLDYEMASTKITGAKNQIALMEKQRLSLLQKIEDRKVKATFNGIIVDLDVAVGDSMEAKDSVGTLVNLDYLIADVEIPETDVPNLKIGQKVEFTFPAYDGKVFGYVTYWPAIGEVTSRGATIVKAQVRIDEYPKEILPNYSFTGKIKITDPVDNIIVDKNAVEKDGDKYFVILAKTGEKVYVTVSRYGGEFVKIESGLKGGETVKALRKNETSGKNVKKNNMMGPPPRR